LVERKSKEKHLKGKPRILIVDDNEKAAKTLAMMCDLSDAEATYIMQGKKAIDQARSIKPDMVLLDIGMPDMDGYEVCRQIRKDPDLRNIKIFANSGWSDDIHRKKSIEAGFDGYLVKPIQIDKLEELIAELRPA
jgi:CheY-like chemotaxis protein